MNYINVNTIEISLLLYNKATRDIIWVINGPDYVYLYKYL